MKAKEYLEQLQDMNIKINQNLQLLEEMKENALCTGGMNYGSDRVQTSHVQGNMEKAVSVYMDFDRQINDDIDAFYTAKMRITNEIHDLRDADHIHVLYKFYVQFKGVDAISSEMKKSKRWVYEKRNAALDEFDRIHPTLEKFA
jgi:hypothetical protein